MRTPQIATDCVSFLVTRSVSTVHVCDDECDAHLEDFCGWGAGISTVWRDELMWIEKKRGIDEWNLVPYDIYRWAKSQVDYEWYFIQSQVCRISGDSFDSLLDSLDSQHS